MGIESFNYKRHFKFLIDAIAKEFLHEMTFSWSSDN